VKRIRVVHIITRFDKGGSAENTFLTVLGLDKRRYDVYLIVGLTEESRIGDTEVAATVRNLASIKEAGIALHIIPELIRNIHPLRDLQALSKMNRLLREIKPHIVHTHTSKAGILGRFSACLNNAPVVVHTPHGHVFWGYFGPLTSRLFIILEKFATHGTDRMVMLTEQEKEDHLHCRIGTEEKFAVIHSGVTLEPFLRGDKDREQMRKELSIPADAFIIGTVGRLTAVKGQRYLLEAAAKLSADIPGLFCIILGDGELREELKAKATDLGIGVHVLFLGWRDDVAAIISVFDVFVLPSLNEGMGRVIVEAMAAGKPIVASDIGGIRNLVAPRISGILVPPADPEALAAGIKDLYRDPDRRERMGEAGRQRAAAFSDTAMIEKIDTLYSELIRDKYDHT
jgi:glycosyltransferase involved in cell wall biosynthesis